MPEFVDSFQSLGDDFFSRTAPEPLREPFLINYNAQLAAQLGLNFSDAEALAIFSGGKKLSPSGAVSAVYAGHQFGSYVAQLGDGRAHLIGEVKGQGGSYEIQLKGSGKTPYSRFGDGKAVLRSSVREYLASEAMHHLGIPSTRALCLVGSDEDVMREGIEKAAVVARVSPSFIRFGHFEYFTHSGKPELTKKLLDHTIKLYFPEAASAVNPYEKFLYTVTARTAKLMAKWQAVGFTHGVMNTDNMSILGLTLDYGPYGFMEGFNPAFVPNHSDHTGRYAYAAQPQVAMWNLRALAYALAPHIPVQQSAEVVELFGTMFLSEYTAIMRAKLGLAERRNNDMRLVQQLLEVLADQDVDNTIFFRALCSLRIEGDNSAIYSLFKNPGAFKDWEVAYIVRLKQEGWSDLNKGQAIDAARAVQMKKHNPKYILRNYLAQQAIEALTKNNDAGEFKKLLSILSTPYDDQPEHNAYAQPAPEWARSISISCSS